MSAVRLDLNSMKGTDPEFQRFAIAFQEMKTTHAEELYALNAIHGGGFYSTYQANMTAFARLYSNTPSGAVAWDSGYCSHTSRLFLIWHRVYVYCMELLLQKCDPQKGLPNLLGLHYWAWDQDAGKGGLPDWATKANFFGNNASGKAIPNPFLSGAAKGSRNGSVQTTRGATAKSVDLQTAGNIKDASKSKTYLEIGMGARSTNLEYPHNALHVLVGGAMRSEATASWDPIFWLHHSNVERMHWSWLADHPTTTTDVAVFGRDDSKDPRDPKDPRRADPAYRTSTAAMNQAEADHDSFLASLLYPFPHKVYLQSRRDAALPWVISPAPSTTNDISLAGEWLDNGGLLYSYGLPSGQSSEGVASGIRTSSRLMMAMAVPGSNKQNAVKMLFQILHVRARGSGEVTTQLKIGKTTIDLGKRYVFSKDPEFYCANCETTDLGYGWDLHLTPEQAAMAHMAKVVSFQFNGVDIPAGFEAGWYDEDTGFTALEATDASAPPTKKSRSK